MRFWRSGVPLLIALCVQAHLAAAGVNGEILQQRLDAERNGYTVMRVWGSQYEMGYVQGYLPGEDIAKLVKALKGYAGAQAWAAARPKMGASVFKPVSLENHLNGLLAGMRAKSPGLEIDVLDLEVLNTASDWLYATGCRSHSCWGRFVSPPVKTLTTRRLDWGEISVAHNHVLCAYDPPGDSDRWIGIGLPGTFAAGALLTESGTVVAMQDYLSRTSDTGSGPKVMTRAVATLYAALIDLPADRELPLDAVYKELRRYTPFVGGFLCYYAPGGKGGVITSGPSQGFYDKRTPEESYFGGDVLVTTNSWTDGTTTPEGGEFLYDYYAAGGAESLADHWSVMGDPSAEFHQVSVEFRGPGDMTVWFNGRIPGGGRTPRVELEWRELFRGPRNRGE